MRIFLSVGDLSGDLHCAALVRALKQRQPALEIDALCGEHTAREGARQIGDTGGLGVIGLASALAVLPRSLALLRRARHHVGTQRPDLALLCDWGGFNTRFLPFLRELNVPVFYYFPPRSWHKAGERALGIAPHCARIATPFEWSAQRLNEAGGRAEWVGHPILERLQALPPREEIRARLGVMEGQKLVVALPGSRAMELATTAPHVASACHALASRGLKIIVAGAPGATAVLQPLFGDIPIVEDQSLELLRAGDAAIVKSGTSTLEAAAADCPQVVVYDIPPLLRFQATLTGLRKKLRFVAMPNLLCEREIVPELLEDECRGPQILAAIEPLLFSPGRAATMRHDYAQVRAALGDGLPYTATTRTADLVLETLRHRKTS